MSYLGGTMDQECTNEEWKRELHKFAFLNLIYGIMLGFCAGVFVVTNFG